MNVYAYKAFPVYHKCSRPSTGFVAEDRGRKRSVFTRPKANILAMTAREVRVTMKLALDIEGRM
jgi:hypothetical protein